MKAHTILLFFLIASGSDALRLPSELYKQAGEGVVLPALKMRLHEYPKEGCTVWKMLFLAHALNFTDVTEWQAYRETWGGNIHTVPSIPGKWELERECEGCAIIFPMRDPHLRIVSSYLDNRKRSASATWEGDCLRKAFGTPWPPINDWFMEVDALMKHGKTTCMFNHYAPLSKLGAFAAWDAAPEAGNPLYAFDLPDTAAVANNLLGLPIDIIEDTIRAGTTHSHKHGDIELNATTLDAFEALFKDDIEFYTKHVMSKTSWYSVFDEHSVTELGRHSVTEVGQLLSDPYWTAD